MEKLGINFTNLDNVALVAINSDGSHEKIKYKELQKQVIKTSLVIEEFDVPKESTVGILLKKKSFQLVALTIGIIESDFSFCYITNYTGEENARTDLIDFNSRYFFSEIQMDTTTHFKLLKTITIFGKQIHFYKLDIVRNLRTFENAGDEMFKLCYLIKTSGTSGRRKIVHVTYNSIHPNITSLQRIFNLDHTDVILSVSPITFDPFMVDLFLSLRAGSSLMFIADSLRFESSLFGSTGVTFLQTTPTLFQQYGIDAIQKSILGDTSSLKYLVLGGERFPLVKEIVKWQNWDVSGRKRIFNIYGITEMSCWATIHEVTKEDLKCERIPLGIALDETDFAYYSSIDNYNDSSSMEELVLISKSRICFIDNSDVDKNLKKIRGDFFAQRTGDCVKRIDGKIFWHGRTNDTIKRFGERVNLSFIEAKASEFLESSQVACVFVKKRVVLFYQLSADVNEQLFNFLKSKLNSNEIPDDIRRVEFLPINEHGKISKEKLRELYKDIYSKNSLAIENIEEIFLDAINQMFNLKLNKPCESSGDEPDGKRMRGDIDSTFNQLGGKSFDALRIAMRIEEKMSMTSNGLLPKLLDNQHTIKELCGYLKQCVPKNKLSPVKMPNHNANFIKELYSYDLLKCVDSSPSLLTIKGATFISVGSHSNKLVNIDALKLSVTSKLNLGDRIECEVAQFRDYGLVGCYDGNLYCFDVLNGEIKWKYHSNAMIKSKPLVISSRISDDLIIFGNYDYEANLHCIKVDDDESVKLVWSKMLGKLGIFANILQINNDSIIVATLGSTLHKINISDGKEKWCKALKHPVFSSPQKIPNKNEFLVAEVAKNIYCIDFDGNTMWTFNNFDGQIFSSFLFTSDASDNLRIIFGSHDQKLRCLKYQDNKIDLEWSVTLQSQIYCTPKIYKEYIIACSTSGFVNFINLNEGSLEYSKKLPGEIFSTPLVFKNMIFIGCRDNFVYTLKL